VEGVVPRPDVAPLLQEHFVALAADADASDPGVMKIAMQLEGAMMLPFVLFTDAEGNFIDGYSGVVTPPYLKKTLEKLTSSPA
jgi:hypothetical protein